MSAASQLQTGWASVSGGQLYYEVAGEGHPLVLIHAGVADCRMWDDQFEVFAQHFRVVRYDTRGFGKSRTETGSFSNRQDLAELLAYLSIQQAHLLGLSRGGQIAVDFTLEYPEKVTALILAAAGVSGYEHHPGDDPKSKTEYQMFMGMDELWEQREFEQLNDLEVRMWADGPGQPEGRAPHSVREKVRLMNAASFNRQDGEVTPQPLDPPALGRLPEIRVLTLILVGDLDTTGTLAMAEVMAQNIVGAQKVVFPGVAHMRNLEAPATFNQVVLDFLKSVAVLPVG